MAALAAHGFTLQSIKVKNTFIEEEEPVNLDPADDMIRFAKRQVSEPAPSIGKLMDMTGRQNTWTLASHLLENQLIPEGSQADPTQKDLPGSTDSEHSGSSEPERESDCSDSLRQNSHEGYMSKTTTEPGGGNQVSQSERAIGLAMPDAPLSMFQSQPNAIATAEQHLAFMVASGKQSPPPPWNNVQTIMMRNLPNKVDRSTLRSIIDAAGFMNAYDFVYLPIDPDTEANRGYAFFNFITPGFAFLCRLFFEGKKFCETNSRKTISVMPATLQGFEANYAHYSKTRITQGDPDARPLFLREPCTKTQRGGRNKTQSLIDMATRQLRKQEQQLKGQQRDEFQSTEEKPSLQIRCELLARRATQQTASQQLQASAHTVEAQ
jgi:hypothetical protein